jgi:NAD(P)-dependent dehydrogenase (short-subunit alcohol dehydrogenase family)
MGLLDGKVAIITGAGGGIGREHAIAFAKEGAKLVINDLGGTRDGAGGDGAMANLVCEEIKKMGGEAIPNYDSVSNMQGGENLTKAAISKFGKVDILVNNAGILRDKTIMKMTEGEWDSVIAVHLKGVYSCTQPMFKHLRERGQGGRIINTSSVAGLMGNFGQANYASAKAGIYGFTRVISMEGAKYGITCNAIAPIAKTRMTEDLPMFNGLDKEMAASLISPIVVYLASDLSKEINGKIIGVQGGKLFSYYMKTSEGILKETDGGLWSVKEIAAKINDILGLENS